MDPLDQIADLRSEVRDLAHSAKLQDVQTQARLRELDLGLARLEVDMRDAAAAVKVTVDSAIQTLRGELRPYLRTLNLVAGALVLSVVGAFAALVFKGQA